MLTITRVAARCCHVASGARVVPRSAIGASRIQLFSTNEETKESKESVGNRTPPTDGDSELLKQLEAKDQEITALKEEVKKFKDQTLRTLADSENLRKRLENEKNVAKDFALQDFSKDLLEVADNLGLAISNMPEDASTHSSFKSVYDGVVMTEKVLHNVFNKHNIQMYDPLGGKFDPNLHDAMFEVQNPEKEGGTVCQVVRTGYLYRDRVLRPAKVGVVASSE